MHTNPSYSKSPGPGSWREGVTAEEMADYVGLRPEVEAEIKYAESTKAGLLRHAEFVTLRDA